MFDAVLGRKSCLIRAEPLSGSTRAISTQTHAAQAASSRPGPSTSEGLTGLWVE